MFNRRKENCMKKIHSVITWIILFFAPVLSFAQQSKNGKEHQSNYSFTETVELLSTEAKQRSWNIPVIHDLQKSLAKSDQNVQPVTVIEICKPEYSGRLLALNSERIISVFMPCRISVYEKANGKTYVATIDGRILAADQPANVADIMIAVSDEIFDILKTVTK